MADDAAPARRSARREAAAAAPSRAGNGGNDTHDAATSTPAAAEAEADAAATAAEQPSSSTRRSRRHVKSTYATHALMTPSAGAATTTVTAPLTNVSSKEKLSASGADAVDPTEESDRTAPPKRRRPSSAPSSKQQPVAALSSSELAETPAPVLIVVPQTAPSNATNSAFGVVSPTAASPAAAPSVAMRRRHPSGGRQTSSSSVAADTSASTNNNNNGGGGNGSSAAGASSSTVTPMGDADVSARTQARKVLGRYTARECTLLCEAILQQLKRNSVAPNVLDCELSPAHIRWDKIALKMLKSHRLAISPRDAQELWKFLAYAEPPPPSHCDASASTSDELLAASDSEDFATSVQTVNDRHRASRAVADKVAIIDEQVASATDEQETPVAAALSDKDKASPAAAAASAAALVSPHFQLYPAYDLPTGQPESWSKPFNAKAMLPLTFAAEKFLRRKPGVPEPEVIAAPAEQAAGAAAGASAASDTAPKKKRGRKANPKPKGDGEGVKKPRAAQKSPTAAKTPRSPFVPSSTPPPQPLLPRAAFQFFCRMYEENPALAAPDASTPAPSALSGPPPAAPPAATLVARTSTPPTPTPTPAPAGVAAGADPTAPVAAPVPAAAAESIDTAPTPATAPVTVVTPALGTATASAAAPAAPAAAPITKVTAAPVAPPTTTTTTTPVAPAAATAKTMAKTPTELQTLFAQAPVHVRSACQKLALEDLDRYNRECVRRRIWEKAMTNQSAVRAKPQSLQVKVVVPPLPPPSSRAVAAPVRIPSLSISSAGANDSSLVAASATPSSTTPATK